MNCSKFCKINDIVQNKQDKSSPCTQNVRKFNKTTIIRFSIKNWARKFVSDLLKIETAFRRQRSKNHNREPKREGKDGL